MRVVAITAHYLAVPDGVRGGPEALRPDILVACVAHLVLGGPLQHFAVCMDLVTAGTGKVLAFVGAALPVHHFSIVPVAFETNPVALFDGFAEATTSTSK